MIRLRMTTCYQTSLLLSIVVLGYVLLSSCSHRPFEKPRCKMPSGVDLAEAITHSKNDLENLECDLFFDVYYEGLIEIAKQDPDKTNKRRFSDFLEWANDQGIINKLQARDYYNRYFNTTFMSLPDDYNVCSSCSEKKQKDLEFELEKELGQKEAGLLRACQDKNAYYLASDQYNSIMMLLDATCTACRN